MLIIKPKQGQMSNAHSILIKMRLLLDRRKTCEVSRRGFLRGWGKLRKALSCTFEYHQLQADVRKRAGGLCECSHQCERDGVMLHHQISVAHAPELALTISNCLLVAAKCHERIDPKYSIQRHRKEMMK